MAISQARRRQRPAILIRAARSIEPFGLFLRGFLKNPAMVGSVIPSGKVLIDRMLDAIDWSAVSLFVEYGPGVGTFSKPILARMRPDATLIAIDTNEDFARYLSKHIADSRFMAVHGSAAEAGAIIAAQGFAAADHVLSGIPFSTLPDGVGAAIMDETARVLRPGGSFLVYQYSAFTRTMLKQNFAHVDEGVVLRNIPPCRTFRAWKGDEVPAES